MATTKDSKIITKRMSHVVTNNVVRNLSANNDTKPIINSTNMRSVKCSESDNQRLPAKKRQITYEEYPNVEGQRVQEINNTKAKTDDYDSGNDDNFHFLMSLLPYLREVPMNKKMAIRNKLQKVFVEEQEMNNVNVNDNANENNNNNIYSLCSTPSTDRGQPQIQSPILHPQYPYPNVHPIHGNINNYGMAAPLQNATITSGAHGNVRLIQPKFEYTNNMAGQQMQQYINANNNIYGYNSNMDHNAAFTNQPEVREHQAFAYLQ